MTFAKSLAHASAAVAALILTACSPPAQKAEEAPAPAPASTPAPAPAEPPAGEPAAATPLDIKDAAGAQLSGDAAAGARIFRQCQTCHTTDAGVNRVGPSLHAIIGRQAGTVAGFRYSSANKNSGIVWTEQALFDYLENPRAEIPGTTMSFIGVKDPQQRADLIAYLKANTQ